LKLFAKTNVHFNNGILFKSIVLLNADFLTIDAQSALRRCIELFSHTTRFFIIIENKNKLLNPILSRFCTIYVPDYMVDGKIVNLHEYFLNQKYPFEDILNKKQSYISHKLDICFARTLELGTSAGIRGLSGDNLLSKDNSNRTSGQKSPSNTQSLDALSYEENASPDNPRTPATVPSSGSIAKHTTYLTTNNLNDLVCHFYEHGFSCLDIMEWIEQTPLINVEHKPTIAMKYHKIRREFRCEKMLMFFLLLSIKRFV
jgi:hypothetical protein